MAQKRILKRDASTGRISEGVSGDTYFSSDPSVASDLATKNYVDSQITSKYTVVSKTTTYTAVSYDDVWCNGTFTVTSPSPATNVRFKVANEGTGAITVSFASGTFKGNSSMILGTQYSSVELSSDGTNWQAE